MVVDKNQIREIFEKIFAHTISWEEAAAWANKRVYAADDHDLIYQAEEDEDAIWDALIFLIGVDLEVSPNKYLHCEYDIRVAYEEFLGTIVGGESNK